MKTEHVIDYGQYGCTNTTGTGPSRFPATGTGPSRFPATGTSQYASDYPSKVTATEGDEMHAWTDVKTVDGKPNVVVYEWPVKEMAIALIKAQPFY